MRIFIAAIATLASVALSGPAHATWFRAETDRVVVYGDVDRDTLHDYAARLSSFDQVLRIFAPGANKAPPARKLDVYLVRNHTGLTHVRPGLPDLVVGFYSASPGAVFAIGMAQPIGMKSKDEVLFHEYAHHFMLENFPAAYPTWFIEGWADYFSTTTFTPTGFQVGAYDAARAAWLFNGQWVPIRTLLRAPERTTNPLMFYAQAWLLTHYMYDDQARATQMNTAMQAIAKGADPVKAVEDATGASVDRLASDLRRYRQIHIANFAGRPGSEPVVTMSALPDAEGELRLDRLRLAVADPKKGDGWFLRDLRGRAAKAPQDELLQLTAAQAEYVYGDPATGEAIVRRWLDAKPDDIQALTTAGLGGMSAAERLPARKAELYRTARAYLIRAYRLDDSDYRTVLAYARSRSIEDAYPNDNDINALLSARGLAPSVSESSLWAGAALIRRGRADEGGAVLAAVANNPHDTRMAKAARAIMGGKSLDDALAEADGPPAKAEPDKPQPPKAEPAKPNPAPPAGG